MSGNEGGFRFLCGAEMDPTAVRRAYPEARFVARARTTGDGGREVWGILLSGAEAGDGAPVAEVTTDDGRVFSAAVPHAAPQGEAEAVLAAARYWELPPGYVRSLTGWVETPDT